MTKPYAIIVDLDGTLSDARDRRHLLPNFEKFHSACESDPPNEWCKALVQQLRTRYDIVIVSGRTDDYKDATLRWFAKHGILVDALFMRKAGDFRPDTEIKKEIYENEILPKYEVMFCIDDRQCVVDMWRSLGLVCLQCDIGDF